MPDFRTLDELDPKDKRCLVRVDLNVPFAGGKVADRTRIRRVLPTLQELAQKGGKVILLAHFGRPKGRAAADMSLSQVVPALSEELRRPVRFVEDCIGQKAEAAVAEMVDGEVLVLENTRFHAGEEKNDPALAKAMAKLGDVYVNDAFSAAHRAHASTEGVARLLPSFAGRAMQGELAALQAGLGKPQAPVMAIVGGAKVSTKIELLQNLTSKVDMLVIGGGMANTFLAALGKKVGQSLCEIDFVGTARRISAGAEANACEIILPLDVVVAREFKAGADNSAISVDAVPDEGMILDVGPRSVSLISEKLERAKTLVWNGPLGAFELAPFDAATVAVAKHAAALTKAGRLTSIAGGGDTVSALSHAGVLDDFSYVSTAGGAFLEWMEGKRLPGVEALKKQT